MTRHTQNLHGNLRDKTHAEFEIAEFLEFAWELDACVKSPPSHPAAPVCCVCVQWEFDACVLSPICCVCFDLQFEIAGFLEPAWEFAWEISSVKSRHTHQIAAEHTRLKFQLKLQKFFVLDRRLPTFRRGPTGTPPTSKFQLKLQKFFVLGRLLPTFRRGPTGTPPTSKEQL